MLSESLRAVNSRIPRDLETVVMTCLEKDPERRYQTVLELAQDIRAHLDGRPVFTETDGLHRIA